MDLLERTALLDELDGRLAAAARGGCIVLLGGEVGIGRQVATGAGLEEQPGEDVQVPGRGVDHDARRLRQPGWRPVREWRGIGEDRRGAQHRCQRPCRA